MRPGQNEHWAKRLGEWEANGEGPVPAETFWAGLAADLQEKQDDRRFPLWWWGAGLILLMALIGGVLYTTTGEENEMEALTTQAVDPPVSIQDQPSEVLPSDNRNERESGAPTRQPEDQESIGKKVLKGNPTPVSAIGSAAATRRSPAERQGDPATVVGQQTSISVEDGSLPSGIVRFERPVMSASPLIPALLPLVKFEEPDQEFQINTKPIGLLLAGKLTSFVKNKKPTSFALAAGAVRTDYRVIRPEFETPFESIPQRVWAGYGAFLEGEVSHGNWWLSLAAEQRVLLEEITFNRLIRLDRSRETVAADGSRVGEYSLDVKSISGQEEMTSVTVRRDGGPSAGLNPILRLTFEENSDLNLFTVPLSVGYRGRVGNFPIGYEAGVGISRTWSTFRRSVNLVDATFLNGTRPRSFVLADRNYSNEFNFWSYQVMGGLVYPIPSSPWSVHTRATFAHSMGDWAEERPEQNWLRGISIRVGARYRF